MSYHQEVSSQTDQYEKLSTAFSLVRPNYKSLDVCISNNVCYIEIEAFVSIPLCIPQNPLQVHSF